MKKHILFIILFLSAFMLLQCQHVKNTLKELNDLAKESREKTEENSQKSSSSSFEEIFGSSDSGSGDFGYSDSGYSSGSGSSTGIQKKRKEI